MTRLATGLSLSRTTLPLHSGSIESTDLCRLRWAPALAHLRDDVTRRAGVRRSEPCQAGLSLDRTVLAGTVVWSHVRALENAVNEVAESVECISVLVLLKN